jgi:hypothetical protein
MAGMGLRLNASPASTKQYANFTLGLRLTLFGRVILRRAIKESRLSAGPPHDPICRYPFNTLASVTGLVTGGISLRNESFWAANSRRGEGDRKQTGVILAAHGANVGKSRPLLRKNPARCTLIRSFDCQQRGFWRSARRTRMSSSCSPVRCVPMCGDSTAVGGRSEMLWRSGGASEWRSRFTT